MARHRDFDAARAEQAGEPLTFLLDGYTFACPPQMPAGPLLDLAALADESDQAKMLGAFARFLRALVVPADRGRLDEALSIVTIDVIVDVARWLIEEQTGRPLGLLSASDGSSSPPGLSSTVASPEAA